MDEITANNTEHIHILTESQAVAEMGSSSTGLTADQAHANQEKYGKNVIAKKKENRQSLSFLKTLLV